MTLKLLDYGKPKLFGEIIGKPRYLAWPVNAYRVTLPKVTEDGNSLNPFERVILKIISNSGPQEAGQLAQETCIPIDLVQCVLLRLRDKMFIDEHNGIIIQSLYNEKTKEEKPLAFVTMLLFRELATGKIMPYLQLVDDYNPLKKEEIEETKFKVIRYDEKLKYTPPVPRDVISALRATKKRSMYLGSEVHLPKVHHITIAHEPELYYLNCPIAIQKSDSEFRIADPFGNGFSLILENAFSRLLEQGDSLSNWLWIWKQSLINLKPDKQVETRKEPYDNDANRGRYPKLVSNLRLSENTRYRSIEKIYAAIEWALFYLCVQGDYDTAVNLFQFTNQTEHPTLLNEAVENIGLDTPPFGFRPVLYGKLLDYKSGKAEMGTVLSIALLMAQNDAVHPLRRLAVHHQDFIIQIFDIKKRRDLQRHGHGKVQKNERELPEEVYMRQIVPKLLPTIRFSDTPSGVEDNDSIADTLLIARNNIQSEYGFRLFNQLGTELQDRLIHAECFWLSCNDNDDALAFACDIYASLQKAFRQRLFRVIPPDIKDSDLLMMAQEKTMQCGLGQLPECLSTVKQSSIRKTLQGYDPTLGACAIAFLLVSDEDTLRSIAENQSSFISDVAGITTSSPHGNEPLHLLKAEIAKLRKSALTTIKTIMEVHNG